MSKTIELVNGMVEVRTALSGHVEYLSKDHIEQQIASYTANLLKVEAKLAEYKAMLDLFHA